MSAGNVVVDRKDILSGLKMMGIREGDVLLVHSSLTATAWKRKCTPSI